MFMLYAVVVGVLLGLLGGGRLDALALLRLRWTALAALGLIVQLALFSPFLPGALVPAGPAVYVVSTALVGLVVLRNLAIPGMAVVAAGALANLVAIVANGGYMPATPDALAALGARLGEGFSNSVLTARPNLELLVDRFALPAWLPMANVFSVGDVVIVLGIVTVIAVQMRAPAAQPAWTGVAAA